MKTSIKALTIALGVLSTGISAYAAYSSDMDQDMNQTQENRWSSSSTTERWSPTSSTQPQQNRWSTSASDDSSMRMRNVSDEDMSTSKEDMSMSETSARPYRSMDMDDGSMNNAPMYNGGYNNGCCPKPRCQAPCAIRCQPAPRCAPAPCAPRCQAPCAPVCRARCEPVCKPRCAPCAPVCKPRCAPCAPVCKPRCQAPCAPRCRTSCAPVCAPRCPAPCPCAPRCRARCEPCAPKCCNIARPCCINPDMYQPYGVNYYPGYGYGTQYTN